MEEKQISINNLKVNYKIAGKGEMVLLLHGWGKGSDAWVEAGELLAKDGYQAIIPDLPGFGQSQAPDKPWFVNDYLEFLFAFCDALGLKDFDLIGHSFGAGLAAAFVAHNPQLAKSLILIDAAIIRKERLSLRQQLAKGLAKAKPLAKYIPIGIYDFLRKAVYKIAGVHDYQKAGGVMHQTFKNIIGQDLTSAAPFVKIPTLIVWGDLDDSTPLQDARTLNKMIAGSRLEIIKNCGHNPHLTHSKQLIEIIDNFL